MRTSFLVLTSTTLRLYTGLGLTVAYDIDPVMLSLGVVSENDWTESKPDPENKDVVDCHTHALAMTMTVTSFS